MLDFEGVKHFISQENSKLHSHLKALEARYSEVEKKTDHYVEIVQESKFTTFGVTLFATIMFVLGFYLRGLF